ncbi:FAA-hydrolase domain-containing protein [Mycena indigotica]|uniref:FAA-hydrolase domain-containing protein n=1 Tax=Mycena indigotica TaxID=2126181 RepID=A0A8H6SA47_9AGAR|nr:FAA-hydrolase domain-containing protein [Mycena indigotica]KAF7295663.1 FAA-hydrolase domain-containing protein [Mycena indigotica]
MAASFVRNGKKASTAPRYCLQFGNSEHPQIIGISTNYETYIKGRLRPVEPVFFLKPTTSYLLSGGKVEIPAGVIAHHEVELGVVIGKRARAISKAEAEAHVAGYALAVDMSARNVQHLAKKQGLPWSAAKGFDSFLPIGPFIPKDHIPDPHNVMLTLQLNGAFRQNGSTSTMIFRIPRLIEHVSSIMTLEEGDLILTGTPDGVGPVNPGDNIQCTLLDSTGRELSRLAFDAVAREGGYKFSADRV